MTPEERLAERGLALPALRPAAGNYRGWTRAGDLLHLSGQGANGHVGRLGADLTVDQGYAAAQACALNLLAQAHDALGALSAVRQVVQVRGFVCCTDDFTEQAGVVNGASDLFVAVFGEQGVHARTSIGVAALPLGFAVEVDAVLLVERDESEDSP